jgi:hypothetical protein
MELSMSNFDHPQNCKATDHTLTPESGREAPAERLARPLLVRLHDAVITRKRRPGLGKLPDYDRDRDCSCSDEPKPREVAYALAESAGAARLSRDPVTALALACADLVEVDIADAPLGPETKVWRRRNQDH